MDGLWATKSKGVRLIERAISFQDFQPMWSWSTNVSHRRTDRRTTCNLNTALCTSPWRGKNRQNTVMSAMMHEWSMQLGYIKYSKIQWRYIDKRLIRDIKYVNLFTDHVQANVKRCMKISNCFSSWPPNMTRSVFVKSNKIFQLLPKSAQLFNMDCRPYDRQQEGNNRMSSA